MFSRWDVGITKGFWSKLVLSFFGGEFQDQPTGPLQIKQTVPIWLDSSTGRAGVRKVDQEILSSRYREDDSEKLRPKPFLLRLELPVQHPIFGMDGELRHIISGFQQ